MPINPAKATPESVRLLARAVASAGGRAWLVGGSVRDILRGQTPKDWDVEVHGLHAAQLRGVLRKLGPVQEVGRSFGVFKMGAGPTALDIALPQLDSAPGTRASDTDGPHLTMSEAAKRRDLTINAIAMDPLTGALADPTGGAADLAARRLQAADPDRFGDDPLRVLRVVRFACALDCTPTRELVTLCRAQDLTAIPGERIFGELDRILCDGPDLSRAVDLLDALGVLAQLAPIPAAQARLDMARAQPIRDAEHDRGRRLALALGALLLRLDLTLAEPLLVRLHIDNRHGHPIRDRVVAALAHWRSLPKSTDPTGIRTLAESIDLELVTDLAIASGERPDAVLAQQTAAALGVARQPLPPLLRGRDLTTIGIPPGPSIGQVLRLVREEQLKGALQNATDALAYAQSVWSPRSSPD